MKRKIVTTLKRIISINLVIVLLGGFIVSGTMLSEEEPALDISPDIDTLLFAPSEFGSITAYAENPSTEFTYAIANNAVTITGYTGNDVDIVIPETIEALPVRAVGASAFINRTALRSVVLPETLASIGSNAFQGCTALTRVEFEDSAVDIGTGAFRDCTRLAEVDFGNSIKTIGNTAFYSTGLITVTIPSSVTSIGSSAFSSCTALTRVDFEDSEADIGSSAFSGCTRLASVDFGNMVKTIGNSAFNNTGLVMVIVPSRSLGQKSQTPVFWRIFRHASLNSLEIKQLFLRKFA